MQFMRHLQSGEESKTDLKSMGLRSKQIDGCCPEFRQLALQI